MIEAAEFSFEAADGQELAGSWFVPGNAPRAALVLNGGTGIPRGFYRRFAAFAAAQGFAVLTYDYRGVGGSAPEDLSACDAVFRDWGHYDVPAAIDVAKSRFPELPLAVVGHSAGGQHLGLAHNVSEVDAALFVGVSTGYWRGLSFQKKWTSWVLWNVLAPASSATIGYFPAQTVGLGVNLPAGVAAEWGAWCMEPTYMAAYFDETGHRTSPDGRPFGPTHFTDACFPLQAYCFTDDDIATRANVPVLMSLYTEADVSVRWIEPSEAGVAAVGHLGFFREHLAQSLWGEALENLCAAAGA